MRERWGWLGGLRRVHGRLGGPAKVDRGLDGPPSSARGRERKSNAIKVSECQSLKSGFVMPHEISHLIISFFSPKNTQKYPKIPNNFKIPKKTL